MVGHVARDTLVIGGLEQAGPMCDGEGGERDVRMLGMQCRTALNRRIGIVRRSLRFQREIGRESPAAPPVDAPGPGHDSFVDEVAAERGIVVVVASELLAHGLLVISDPRLEVLGKSLEHDPALQSMDGDLVQSVPGKEGLQDAALLVGPIPCCDGVGSDFGSREGSGDAVQTLVHKSTVDGDQSREPEVGNRLERVSPPDSHRAGQHIRIQ